MCGKPCRMKKIPIKTKKITLVGHYYIRLYMQGIAKESA